MTLKTSKPARVGAGSGIAKAVEAFIPENRTLQATDQYPRAAFMLSRRFGLPAPTAALVATLAGFAEVRHG